MAYVRTHGNQLAIVHGERDPESRKVQQRVLFSLYSKSEALAALGQGDGQRWNLQHMLEDEYPGIRFDWDKIEVGITERMDALPETYPYRAGQVLGRFREDMVTFVRQLELADPQTMYSAARLLSEQRVELEYIRELIYWRLQLCEQDESDWNGDNEFFWRHRLRGRDIPPEAMERIGAAWDQRQFERVEALAHLYIDCFEAYADGHHYLGLIALEREDLETAIDHFERAVTVGRRLFPKRLAKKHYWLDINTRPYMRALRSLTIALNRAGAYEEALARCNCLEKECGDLDAATTFRATIFLNMGRWKEARDAALSNREIWPTHSMIAAFAYRELNETHEALACFLHGILNRPRTVRMLLGVRTNRPKAYEEIKDHNEGIEERFDLQAYLGRPSRTGRQYFRGLVKAPHVVALLEEVEDVRQRLREAEEKQERHEAFTKMNEMQSIAFARARAAQLTDDPDI